MELTPISWALWSQWFRLLPLISFSNVYLNPALLPDPSGITTSFASPTETYYYGKTKFQVRGNISRLFSRKQTQFVWDCKTQGLLNVYFFVLMFACMSFLTGFSQNCYEKEKKGGFVGVSEMESQSHYAISQKRQATLLGLKCCFLDQNGFRKTKH